MAIISIFGLAGTGKSTAGKMLAKNLGYTFVSTGTLFRQMAEDKGMTLYEFEKIVHDNPAIDTEFDIKIREYGEKNDNFVIESRLAWYFIPHSIKIKFSCSEEVRLNRVAQRDGISVAEAKEKTLFRESLHKERYKKLYGISDYTADEHFEEIIYTTEKSPEEIVATICKKIQEK